jgi:probable rRNA maturation factor
VPPAAGRVAEARTDLAAADAADTPDTPDGVDAAHGERRRSIYRDGRRIDLTIRPGVRSPLSQAAVAAIAARALAMASAPPRASVGILLSDDRELARLNTEYMGHGGPTDVLSFPLLPPSVFPPHEGREPDKGAAAAFVLPPGRRVHLGDVMVSVERAADQAARGFGGQTGDVRWSVADELRLLVVHGALHVCGWDHAAPAEERAMRELERRILAPTLPESGGIA